MKHGVVKLSDVVNHPTMRMDPEYWLNRQEQEGDDEQPE